MRKFTNYQAQEMKKNIPYPNGLGGQFDKGCLDSNSFAQSLIEHSVGIGRVHQDFDGVDACNTNRINSSYFAPLGPVPPIAPPPPASTVPAGPAAKTVEVNPAKPGQATLSGIARTEYGAFELWPLIYDENKGIIGADPNRLRPGTKLQVKPLASYMAPQIADAKRRAPKWK